MDLEAALRLDAAAETLRIGRALREQVGERLRRRGVVLGMSGGVDSSVCAALAAQAFGARRVLALFMPERESDPAGLALAQRLATQLCVPFVIEDVTRILEAAGCYARRDAAIRRVVPEYDTGWRCKITLSPGGDGATLGVVLLTVQSPDDAQRTLRLPASVYLEIVAATNMKQRVRKSLEYHHADRLHYAVLGTPNRLEWDQGFFVKGGDGLADVKPIAHLYKTQVYQLATHLGIPEEVTARPPSTDTYSLPQSQEEFFFRLPLALLDRLSLAERAGVPAEETARQLALDPSEVRAAWREMARKRATTRYLHEPPLFVDADLCHTFDEAV